MEYLRYHGYLRLWMRDKNQIGKVEEVLAINIVEGI